MASAFVPHFDQQALRLVGRIERSILRLDLPSQAQFVSILNAIEVQIESLEPDPSVVGHLLDALLALAQARGLDVDVLRLPEQLCALRDRFTPKRSRPGAR